MVQLAMSSPPIFSLNQTFSSNLCPMRLNASIAFAISITLSVSANAGLFGIGGTSWKEEVLLHDGSTMVVDRSQSYGGRHEIGQTPPINEQEISFSMPGTGERVLWKSEYGEDIGRANFLALALHLSKGTAYVVAEPHLCLSYNKWERPNPPYVIFKYQSKEWKQVPLQELPSEFKNINLVISTKAEEKTISAQSLVSADLIKELNNKLTQPEYRTILREPVTSGEGSLINCEKLVFYKGAWVGPGDSIGKRMRDLETR